MPCILIIDDDEAVRAATKILLDANGYDVVAVAEGASGINAAKSRKFDVVIIDLFMPGMDGLDTTKAIRKHDPLVSIITVSGFMFGGSCPEMPNFESMSIEAGATLAVYKPFRPKEFLQVVRNAIVVAA